MERLWAALKLDPALTSQRPLEVGPNFVLALLESQPTVTAHAARLQQHVKILQQASGPTTILGSAVAALPEVPPHLRAQLMVQIQLLCRLRNEAPTLETAADVRAYLQSCDGLLSKLTGEWWAVEDLVYAGDGAPRWEGRELRPEYEKL